MRNKRITIYTGSLQMSQMYQQLAPAPLSQIMPTTGGHPATIQPVDKSTATSGKKSTTNTQNPTQMTFKDVALKGFTDSNSTATNHK